MGASINYFAKNSLINPNDPIKMTPRGAGKEGGVSTSLKYVLSTKKVSWPLCSSLNSEVNYYLHILEVRVTIFGISSI